jgi:AcrR family transcriptional regulator
MSPRHYRSERRQAATIDTRARIVEAAREILTSGEPRAFTMDSVADRAGVARMTVYHQFGSKQGLVAAVSDDLAERGGMGRLPQAFSAPDALAGLRILVEVFNGMWASQGEVVRGLQAFTRLEPENRQGDRNAWRHRAITTLLGRLVTAGDRPHADQLGRLADVLQVLTSFEAFESFTAQGREPEAVADLILATAESLIGAWFNPIPIALS